ncbi:MAG: hypothetical protein WD850_00745 [Candidatus Spechtbacterales bacterium]
MRPIFFLASLSLFLGMPLVAAAHTGDTEGAVIHMDESGYRPADVTIPQGETVTFENVAGHSWPASNIHPTHRAYPESGLDQCGTSEEEKAFDACRALAPGESYTFRFVHAGEWRYHDHLDPRLKGTIIVTAVEGFAEAQSTEDEAKHSIWRAVGDFLGGTWSWLTGLFTEEPDTPEGITYREDITRDADILAGGAGSESILYSYVRKFGPAAATKRANELQAHYGSCHQAAHDIGKYAYLLEGAKAFQSCSAECHSGCYHGATENYFRDQGTANLIQNISVICSSDLNPFFSHQCVHGIGHGLMAWADYDIFEALENCSRLPNLRESCYTGAYMENIVGGLAFDQGHITEYLSDDPHMPCNVVDEPYKSSCYFYQTSRMVQLFAGDFGKVADACLEAPKQYHAVCFQSMGRDASGRHPDPSDAIAACRNAPAGTSQTQCFIGIAQNALWDESGQDDALALCGAFANTEEEAVCYGTLFARAPDVFSSASKQRAFCDKMKQPYRDQCYAQAEI